MLTRTDSAIRIGTIANAPVRVGPGFVLLAAYLSIQLGSQWTGDASPPIIALLALLTGVGFMASIVAHEAGHAIAAARSGIGTTEIRLSLLGGIAALEKGAPSPNVEMKVAAAGPATNIVIGAATIGVALGLDRSGIDALYLNPLVWIGSINLFLGGINLLPGLPLDGGRILAGFLWRRRGDRTSAVRTTAAVGRGLGGLAFALAIYELLVLRSFLGIYTGFIGLVLSRGADAELAQAQLVDRLAGHSVSEITRFQPPMTEESTNTATARALLPPANAEARWAVVRDETGVARGLASIAAIDRAATLDGTNPVSDVMLPVDQQRAAFLTESLADVLRRGVAAPFVVIDEAWRPIGLVSSLELGTT